MICFLTHYEKHFSSGETVCELSVEVHKFGIAPTFCIGTSLFDSGGDISSLNGTP